MPINKSNANTASTFKLCQVHLHNKKSLRLELILFGIEKDLCAVK